MLKAAAVLTIHGAAEMTPKGRKNIARWLERQAKAFMEEGPEYSKNFLARYLYDAEEDIIATDEPPRKRKEKK